MFDNIQVWKAFEAKKDAFREAELSAQGQYIIFHDAMDAYSIEEIEARLREIERPGARPTEDVASRSMMSVKHPAEWWWSETWMHKWARQTLSKYGTAAIHSSSLFPDTSDFLPAGLVQTGLIANIHEMQGDFARELRTEVLLPAELDERTPTIQLDLHRFNLEVEQACAFMQAHQDMRPRPVLFRKGSFTLTFIQGLADEYQERYVRAMRKLLDTSAETKVPIVAVEDNCHARDLTLMLAHLTGRQPSPSIRDIALYVNLMRQGDRSAVFECARDDEIPDYYYERIYFAYLKTMNEIPMARVEFPRWVYENNRFVDLLDVVLAESLFGTGCPYVLTQAKSVAGLMSTDEEQFLTVLRRYSSASRFLAEYAPDLLSPYLPDPEQQPTELDEYEGTVSMGLSC